MTTPRRYVTLEEAQRAIKAMPRLNLAQPGMANVLVNHLSPEDRMAYMEGINRYDHNVELGKWGSTPHACAEMGVDPDVARRAHDSFQVDYVCERLQQRKSDADLPLPETTRRDVLDAAFDAHSTPDPEET